MEFRPVPVRLRLKRFGNRHRPCYRLTAIDQRSARDSKAIEELGSFDPLRKDESTQFNVKEDRVRYWLSVGAQPSETVAALLKKAGIDPKPGQKFQPAESAGA